MERRPVQEMPTLEALAAEVRAMRQKLLQVRERL